MGDLSPGEAQLLCSWMAGLAEARLPPEGTQLFCDGERIGFAHGRPRCDSYQDIPCDCPITVGEAKACYPDLFDYIAANPCHWMKISNDDEYADFVSKVKSCSKYPECLYSDDDSPDP